MLYLYEIQQQIILIMLQQMMEKHLWSLSFAGKYNVQNIILLLFDQWLQIL